MPAPTQLTTARLVLTPRSADVVLRAADEGGQPVEARFAGPEPRVGRHGGDHVVEYPRFRGGHPLARRTAELRLDPEVAWEITIVGGVSRLTADLRGLELCGLVIGGGAVHSELLLPAPIGRIPVRIEGGASRVAIHRPAGAAALLRVGGGASRLRFDAQALGGAGGETRLASAGAEDARDRYELEVLGGASRLTVGTDAEGRP